MYVLLQHSALLLKSRTSFYGWNTLHEVLHFKFIYSAHDRTGVLLQQTYD